MRKIIYFVWLLLCTLLLMLDFGSGTLLILVLSIVIPAAMCALAAPAARRLEISLEAPETAARGSAPEVLVRVKNNSRLPIARLDILLDCHNLLNGSSYEHGLSLALGAHQSREVRLCVDAVHTGALSIGTASSRIFDIFGIIGIKAKSATKPAVISILPEVFDSEIIISEDILYDADSMLYSMEKSGNDNSETFLIREYVQGDSIKSLHYKLSGKVDRLMVRELGLPIDNGLLVLFDNCCSADKMPDCKSIDTIADSMLSFLHAAVGSGLNLTIALCVDGTIEYIAISGEEDIALALDIALSNPFSPVYSSITGMYHDDPLADNFKHIVLFTATDENDCSLIRSDNRITVISQHKCPDCNGVHMLLIDNENYNEALRLVEV